MCSQYIHDQQSRRSVPLLRKINEQELEQMLEQHQQWLDSQHGGEPAGEPADLSNCDLSGINLAGTELRHVNFQGACLRGADLRIAGLREAHLRGANLLDAKLQEADLRDANLNGAELNLCSQLAGADLGGAQLPDASLAFEGLETVEQISRNARTILFSTLLACIYTWLTIATTTDPLLLTNSISSPLPIIRTEIPIAGFFWVAPLILLGLYLYFHIYLQRLWETLSELPAVFPDGTRLDKKAYPWLLNGLAASQLKRLRHRRPQFSRLQTGLSVLLAWWTVPVTLLVLWLRYLPRHDWLGTALHIVLVMVAIGCGILFYRTAMGTLRRDIKAEISSWQFRVSRGGVKRAAFLIVLLILLFGISYGAIHGIPRTANHAVNVNALDVRWWIPRIMEFLGNSTFVDFVEETISTKPANWIENSHLGLIKGARLKNADLAYARARSAFLVKADLRGANLFGADLRNADLRRANLQGANLGYADLSGARLAEVIFKGTSLKGVKLTDYNFDSADYQGIDLSRTDLRNIQFNRADLQGASFEGARLHRIRFSNANLKDANFTGATLDEVLLAGANIQGVQFLDSRGLNGNEIRKTANWIFADFDKSRLSALDLPVELPERVKRKNLSGMNLRGIFLLESNLSKFNLQRSSLQEVRFIEVDLQEADLSYANIQKAKLQGNLGRANLSHADLRRASIRHSDLSQANLQSANLEGALLVEVDMRKANLVQANFSDATFGNWAQFEGAKLTGADFRSSHIESARGLTCEQLQKAIIDDGTKLPQYLGECEN